MCIGQKNSLFNSLFSRLDLNKISEKCIPVVYNNHHSIITPILRINNDKTKNCEYSHQRFFTCHKGFSGHYCDKCAIGFYGYPNCRECDCNSNGVLENCNHKGICSCKVNRK